MADGQGGGGKGRRRGRRARGNPEALDAFRARMGTVSDDEIAKDAGVTRAMVGAYRRRHGIAAYAGYKWQKGVGPPRRKGAGPKKGGRKVAKSSPPSASRKGRPAGGGPKRRKGKSSVLADFLSDLGKLPDDVIAARAGLSRGIVGKFRRDRGIPAYDGYKFQEGHAPLVGGAAPKPRRGRPRKAGTFELPASPSGKASRKAAAVAVSSPRLGKRGPRGRLSEFADLIGTVPDSEIAAMAGVSRPSVATWRHRRGIPPAKVAVVARRAGAGAAVAVAVAGPKRRGRPPGSKNKPKLLTSGGLRAYSVAASRGRERAEYVTVGGSILDVAQRIMAALGNGWSIDELKVLGLAL